MDSSLIEAQLTAIRYAARDINLYEFRRIDRNPLPAAEPGSHIDLHLPLGVVRQYSITVPEASPQAYVVGIKRDPASRGGSSYIFERLRVGQHLLISEPRNNFILVEDAPHVVLIAGGIGITPIWCMAQRLHSLDSSWELHYTCRSRADMAFLETVQNHDRVRLHFNDESAGAVLDLATIVGSASQRAHLYCCGPAPMLEAFEQATQYRPREQVHVEYFAAKNSPNLDGGFVVELARSRREFTVSPGKSILQVLREAGMDVPHSCEEGVCGECETHVISGIPDHRDSILTNGERAANKTMMICCGGCRSERLILDI